MSEIDRLREFVEFYTHCPCCDTNRKCVEGCTFSTDCPDEAITMRAARYALYGDDTTEDKQQ